MIIKTAPTLQFNNPGDNFLKMKKTARLKQPKATDRFLVHTLYRLALNNTI